MHLIDEIQLDYLPRKRIFSRITKYPNASEMSEVQSAFLCGLLNYKKPVNLLEVGVAAGGTTAIMMQCMENLHTNYTLCSIDYREKYYRDQTKATGFLGKEAKEQLHVANWELRVGGCVPDFIDDIDTVDFLFLDTVHVFPGEMLDLLVLLPKLGKDAIVCLHDIALNHWRADLSNAEATNIILHTVSGNKILNFLVEDDEKALSFPNIGAFQVTEATRENVLDLFLSLTMTWKYFPNVTDLAKYSKYIHENYDAACCRVFDEAIRLNESTFNPIPQIPHGSKIILYGAGEEGKTYYYYLKDKYQILHFVDRNASNIFMDETVPVIKPEYADFSLADYVVLAVQSPSNVQSIRAYLNGIGISSEKIVWGATRVY